MAKRDMNDEMNTEGRSMVGTLRKMMLASVGAVGIGKDEIQAMLDRMVARGEMTEKDARKLVNDVQKEVNKRRKGGATRAERELENMLQRFNIPSKADIEDLSQQVTQLSKRIEELKAEMKSPPYR
ncbi:MAG TPA: phasin family protein [Anaerolineae bacterium]|nr:phasin family protein [Anaerolineae bacterium]